MSQNRDTSLRDHVGGGRRRRGAATEYLRIIFFAALCAHVASTSARGNVPFEPFIKALAATVCMTEDLVVTCV